MELRKKSLFKFKFSLKIKKIYLIRKLKSRFRFKGKFKLKKLNYNIIGRKISK